MHAIQTGTYIINIGLNTPVHIGYQVEVENDNRKITIDTPLPAVRSLVARHLATFGGWRHPESDTLYILVGAESHEGEQGENFLALGDEHVHFLPVQGDIWDPPVPGTHWFSAAEYLSAAIRMLFKPTFKVDARHRPRLLHEWLMEPSRPWGALMANYQVLRDEPTLRGKRLNGIRLTFRDDSQLLITPGGLHVVASRPEHLLAGWDVVADVAVMPTLGGTH